MTDLTFETPVHGFSTGVNARTWDGVLSFTRDSTTQVVTAHLVGSQTSGASTNGMNMNSIPAGTIPAWAWPQIDQYPYLDPVSLSIYADGGADVYIGPLATVDVSYLYVSADPAEPAPPPTPVPVPDFGTFEGDFGDWAEFTIAVETYAGSGAWGDSWSVPQQVECWFEPKTQMVITTDGRTLTSNTRIMAGLGYLGVITANSKVTFPDGSTATVLQVASFPGEDGHIEAYTT